MLVSAPVGVLPGAGVLVGISPPAVGLGPAEVAVAVEVGVPVCVLEGTTGCVAVAVGVRVLVGAVVLVGTGPPDVGLGPAGVEVAVNVWVAVDVLEGTAG